MIRCELGDLLPQKIAQTACELSRHPNGHRLIPTVKLEVDRQLVFAHHGESTANVRRFISNRGFVHELTDLGRQQAHELAARIQSPVLKIHTSPVRRAVETTQIVAEAWSVEYEVVDALREYDCGVLEGASPPPNPNGGAHDKIRASTRHG